MNKKVVVGIGELLYDVFPSGKRPGGAPANFAYHASKHGHEGYVVSAIGDDDFGEEITKFLSVKSVNLILEKTKFPTGIVEVKLDYRGVPSYNILPDVAWDNMSYNHDMAMLATRTDAVCFGSLAQRNVVSRQSIMQFVDVVAKNKGLVVFDVNLRQNFYGPTIIHDSVLKSSILKLSEEELPEICSCLNLSADNENEVCKEILNQYGLKHVILTCGAKCSYVFDINNCSYIETPKVNVIDTVGAGDAFTASFVSAILNGVTMSDAHKQAVDYSAYICTCCGAMP